MRIDQIADLDTAREVARLLDLENTRLYEKVKELAMAVANLTGKTSHQLEIELIKLHEQNELLKRRLFARSSERRDGPRKDGEKGKKPQPGPGPRQQKLETVTQQHDLTSPGPCGVCGDSVSEWKGQYEESEEIIVVERRFVLVRHQRKKARCNCHAKVVTAPGPERLIPGGRYSIEFATHVAVAKYLDHMPLHRQARIMEREGLVVDSQTLWDQIDALARHMEPTYQALRRYILNKPLLHADETPWHLLSSKPAKKWYMWCVAVHDAAYYWIRNSRSAEAGGEVINGYEGTIVVDGYSSYGALAKDKRNKGLRLAFCMAHCRRKYKEAEQFYPEECKVVLDLITDLYAVEREVPNPDPLEGQAREDALKLRAKLRSERSRRITDDIFEWANEQVALPESTLGKAIAYMINLWPGLIRFLDDPLVPLDNNLVERQLRGPVVGRKNHYGSRSERGTEVAAILYSLLETAKSVGVEPKAYLNYAARLAIANPGMSVFPQEFLRAQRSVATQAAA